MLILGFFLLLLAASDAMIFPRDCVIGVKTFPTMCCPMYKGSPCGAAYGRGNCMSLPSSRSEIDINTDPRADFPRKLFTAMCECKANYFGHDCGDCKFGYKGEDCSQKTNVMRKEVRQHSPKEWEKLLATMHYCKHNMDPFYVIMISGDRFRSGASKFINASYYDVACYVHYYATMPFINQTTETNNIDPAHQSTGFITWHRAYILHFERQMQKCMKDDSFACPYSDWGFDGNCSICNNTYVGGNNEEGKIDEMHILSTWRTICGGYPYEGTMCMMPDCVCERPKLVRNPGASPYIRKPDYRDVEYCLSLPMLDKPPYDTSNTGCFRGCLEGWFNRYNESTTNMHNLMHLYIGGTMVQVPIACNDIYFFFHHCFIDKMMEVWINRYNIGPQHYPRDNNVWGHQWNVCMVPFFPCTYHPDMLQPISKFGVTFSVFNNL